jgi:hypothetical protein
MFAQRSHHRAGIIVDAVLVIERVHTIDADQQDVFPVQVVRVRRGQRDGE